MRAPCVECGTQTITLARKPPEKLRCSRCHSRNATAYKRQRRREKWNLNTGQLRVDLTEARVPRR